MYKIYQRFFLFTKFICKLNSSKSLFLILFLGLTSSFKSISNSFIHFFIQKFASTLLFFLSISTKLQQCRLFFSPVSTRLDSFYHEFLNSGKSSHGAYICLSLCENSIERHFLLVSI